MRQGTVELAFLGIAFAVLQVWWLSITFKNLKNEGIFNKNDSLTDKRKELEKLFKK